MAHSRWLGGIILTALICGQAPAVLIDFESLTPNFTPVPSLAVGDVTFSGSGGGGQLRVLSTITNGTQGILDFNSPRKEFRADIAGGASFVSVDLGDSPTGSPEESDTIFLEVFDAGGVSLGFTSQLIDTGMHTLSLTRPNIAFAVFGARAPATNGSSVFADNFMYEPAGAAVPEPGAAALALVGMIALARRRI